MKAEYDLSTVKRKGHPLREKVSRGEITLLSPLDIPDGPRGRQISTMVNRYCSFRSLAVDVVPMVETNLSALPPVEVAFVTNHLKPYQNENIPITI